MKFWWQHMNCTLDRQGALQVSWQGRLCQYTSPFLFSHVQRRCCKNGFKNAASIPAEQTLHTSQYSQPCMRVQCFLEAAGFFSTCPAGFFRTCPAGFFRTCRRKLAKFCGLALGMARCIKYNTTGATDDQQCWWNCEFVLWCKRNWIVIGGVFITQSLHTIGHTMIPLRMTTQLVHWQSSQFCLGWDESKGSFEIILLWRDVGNVMPYTSTCQCRTNCRNIRTSPVVSSMPLQHC